MRKRTVGVTIFGLIFIILGIILGLYAMLTSWITYERLKPYSLIASVVKGLSFAKYIPAINSLALIKGALLVIVGIGIFKLKPWAWYLVIASQIIGVLSLSNTGFILGWQAYVPLKLAGQAVLIVFILWFFMRPGIKKQFLSAGEKFKLRSWYAVLIILWLVVTLTIPAVVLGYKIVNSVKRGQPFLVKKPQLIKLTGMGKAPSLKGKEELIPADKASLRDKFHRIRILNLSFSAPRNFTLRMFDKKEGILILSNTTGADKSFIIAGDKPALDIGDTRGVYKVMRLENTYQFEEALYSNNWGLILLILRDISLPYHGNDTQINRFDISSAKGFIKYRYDKNRDEWIYDCSIYDKSNKGAGNISFLLKRKDFSRDEVLRMIASIKVLKERNAKEYYQQGLQLLKEGDSASAQFAFAEAYYLADFPAAGYMLSKTILMNGEQKFDLRGAKSILEEVLTLKPDYPEAEELLSLVNKKLKAVRKYPSNPRGLKKSIPKVKGVP